MGGRETEGNVIDQTVDLPHNEQAEQSVLGAILLKPNVIIHLSNMLQPEDFYLRPHQMIYKAMRFLHEKGKAIDLVTVAAELHDRKILEAAGGVPYLTNLASAVPTAENVDHYANIVRELSSRRKLIQAHAKIYQGSLDGESLDELIAEAEQTLRELRESGASRSLRHLKEIIKEAYGEIERKSQWKGTVTGMPSGFVDLDKLTAGFQNGDLIILAARPSVGKTAFALNVAQNAAELRSEPIAIFSLEMSGEALATRMMCADSLINASKLRSGWLEETDWTKLITSAGRLANKSIYIDDSPIITVGDIRSKCRLLKQEHGLGLVIIDYLQKVRLYKDSSSRRNREQEVSQISSELKAIARELDVPVVALSQLSRSVEQRQDKRPMLSDIRESGSIEQDADVVAFLYRDDYYNQESEKKNVVEVIIAKQRNGPIGTVELAFLKEYNRFVSVESFRKQPDAQEEKE